MTSMIERVALAMEAHCRDVMESRDDAPDIYRRLARSEWQELARIALEGMRDPTDTMVNYGCKARGINGTLERNTNATWHAMIDAALEETTK